MGIKEMLDERRSSLIAKQLKISELTEQLQRYHLEIKLLKDAPRTKVNLLEGTIPELNMELAYLKQEVHDLQIKLQEEEKIQPEQTGHHATHAICRNQALVAETQGMMEHLKRQTQETEIFSRRLLDEKIGLTKKVE